MPADLNLKRLEMLKEIIPTLRRVAIVSRSGNPNHVNLLDEQARFARSLGLQPLVLRVGGREEFEAAFVTMEQQKVEAVCLLQDNVFYEHRLQFMAIAAKFGLAVIGDGKDYADAGALISYGSNYRSMWRRAGVYVDKILKGAKPAELPLDQPMDLELAVNQRVARTLGIKVPVSILTLANHVID
jgi:putative tryptophan/tyrosine transport system substrate-binding protein